MKKAKFMFLLMLGVIFSNSAMAIIIGDHGGSVSAPGITEALEVRSAICETGDYKIFVAEATIGGGRGSEQIIRTTLTVLNLNTGSVEGAPLNSIKFVPEASGYESELLNTYLLTYDANSDFSTGFISFYMEGVEKVEAGTYDTKARVSLLVGEADINTNNATCTGVVIN